MYLVLPGTYQSSKSLLKVFWIRLKYVFKLKLDRFRNTGRALGKEKTVLELQKILIKIMLRYSVTKFTLGGYKFVGNCLEMYSFLLLV